MTKAVTPAIAANAFKHELATTPPLQPHSDLDAWRCTVLFAPHPDDESLGCGGLVTLLRERGGEVHVVFVSDGAMSHPNSVKYDARARRELREGEARRACLRLGVPKDNVRFLRYPDTRVPRHGSAEFAPSASVIAGLLRKLSPSHVLVPWRRDPHCDHRATNELCRAAVAEQNHPPHWIEYPIWMWNTNRPDELPQPGEVIPFRVDVREQLDVKWAAVREHVSQLEPLIDDDPDGFQLSEEMLDNFRRDTELFFVDAEKKQHSLDERYFGGVYAETSDPWSFETSEYEHAKYAHTLAALPRQRYGKGFEIGCSIGVLTKMLAERCDELLSIDVVEAPLAEARKRLAGRPYVRFERRRLPQEFPTDQTFDLIVLSEVGYYWSEEDLVTSIGQIQRALNPGGTLILVHFTPYVPDYPLTGDEVHEAFALHLGRRYEHLTATREERYRLDVYQRRGGENRG